LDSKTDHSVRIQALKELHSLSKTYPLLVKDIPFVTNISKYYDKDILYSNYGSSPYSNDNNQKIGDEINFNKTRESDNQFDFTDIKYIHITDTIHTSNRSESYEDEFMKSVQKQSNYNTANNTISQGHLECIRKLKEIED
jgi:hypothetical protein